MSWRLKLKEQRDLKKQGAELLHTRVSLLVEIETDEGFAQWCYGEGTNVLASLDNELADVGQDYLTLKTVLEHFPDVEQWKAKLVTLIEAVCEKQKTESRESEPRRSWKHIAEELRAKLAEKELQIQRLSAQLEELRNLARESMHPESVA